MVITPIKTRIFKPNEDLEEFILQQVQKLKEGSILVVTSKIVALAQGRLVVGNSKDLKRKIIKQESEIVFKTKHYWLTKRGGELLLSAGVDSSNGDGHIILLPNNPFEFANLLLKKLKGLFGLKKLGIIFTDNRASRMRSGTKGLSIAYAGFKGLRSYIGKKDLFNNEFRASQVNVVDSLAASAVVCMGEGKERQPLAVIQGAPVEWVSKVNPKELYIDPKDDLYRTYFDWLSKQKRKKK